MIERIVEALRPVADQVAGLLTEVARRVEDSQLLDLVAAVADQGLVWAGSEQGQKMLVGIDTALIGLRTADFYGHTRVYRPLSTRLVRDALKRSTYYGPHDMRALLADVGPDSRNWSWISEGLLSSPCLKDRRPGVEDALTCIEQGLWGPAVTTLLPIFEGVVSDHTRVLEGKRVALRLEEILRGRGSSRPNGIGDLIARPALRVIDEEIFARQAFEGIGLTDTVMNRHVILHGRTIGFRTREHALRSLMLIVALAELLDGPMMLRVGEALEADPDLVDDHGTFTYVRQAGTTRVAAGRPLWRTDRVLARRATRAELDAAQPPQLLLRGS